MTEITTTHTVIDLAILAPDALTLPVIVELDDPEQPRIAFSVAKFARYLQREGNYSYAKLRKAVRAIGKLRDFYALIWEKKLFKPGDLIAFIEDFLFHFDHGGVLGWRPASNHSYGQAQSAVYLYVKFLMDNMSVDWPTAEQQFIEECRHSWISSKHAEQSLLFHTKKRQGRKKQGRQRLVVGLRQYKPFPPHLVVPLIEETKNVRDKLIFGLMAFGGRRTSEVVHLFLNDFETSGTKLTVRLRHPVHSPMKWRNQSGKEVKGSRREYLKTVFNLLPRTAHGGKKSAAGWKGMNFDEEATKTSDMYFIRNIEHYLLTLHRVYLYEIRAKVPRKSHPYYFVDTTGMPLKISALQKQFLLACRRLKKKYGVSLEGYGLHSLRHYYGYYCADVLRADLLMIQKWMGHLNPSGTAVYAHITPATASAVLNKLEKKAKLEGRIKITQEEREAIAKGFTTHGLDPIPESWKQDTTKFGILDTRHLKRPVLCHTRT
jgi:integrase